MKEQGCFTVMSRDKDGMEQVETRRTDHKAALEDIDLIKTVLGRAAWIAEDA